jgi:hypothetical protein
LQTQGIIQKLLWQPFLLGGNKMASSENTNDRSTSPAEEKTVELEPNESQSFSIYLQNNDALGATLSDLAHQKGLIEFRLSSWGTGFHLTVIYGVMDLKSVQDEIATRLKAIVN